METIIFTGGSCQLTQHFVKFLQDNYKDKYNIIVTLRDSGYIFGKFIYNKDAVTFETCELSDSYKLIEKYRPDYFFNFAVFFSFF